MSINITIPKTEELKPRIVVIGVGGAGGNAVNNMISSGLEGVEFIAANTDAQALALSKAERRVQMGGDVTQGLGAGMRPEVGESAAEHSLPEILEHLEGTHMLFVAAGMGGGTGTGAAPVIARAARERGILTVAIVTKPFQFEGSRRMELAEAGLEKLYNNVDTLIVIPNQNLFRVATEATTMTDAFAMADEVLNSGVRSVTDLMVVPGQINLDFNDVRTVMNEMGKAMMGTGEATGEHRAIEAAKCAIANPLLDDVSLKGAKAVLINITGGQDLTLYEVDEAASLIRGQVDPDANIIIGSALDKDLDGIVRISVVATGVEGGEITGKNSDASAYTAQTSPVQEQIEKIEQEFSHEDAEETIELEAEEVELVDEETPDSEPEPFVYKRPTPQVRTESVSAPTSSVEPEQRPQAIPVTASRPQTLVKRPFGFFGRKKTLPAAKTAPPPAPTNGDLFGADHEDELEIPSFLRRQNR